MRVQTVSGGVGLGQDVVPQIALFVLDTLIGFQHDFAALAGPCRIGVSYDLSHWSNKQTGPLAYTVPSQRDKLITEFVATGTCGDVPVTDGLLIDTYHHSCAMGNSWIWLEVELKD